MKLPEDLVQKMITHAHKEAPKECVGIIAMKDGEAGKLFKARNVSEVPGRFVVHPKDLYRIRREIADKLWGIFAIYHSHPETEAYPSGDDVESAIEGVPLIIISIQDLECASVRSFTIDRGGITEDLVEAGTNTHSQPRISSTFDQ